MKTISVNKGFTLIELLVVISIIAVLMSIMMPALGRAREGAKMVLCGNNCRQIGYQLTIYGNENKGRFPLYSDAYLNNGQTWSNGTYRYWPYFIDQSFDRFSTKNFPSYFICPSVKDKAVINESNVPYGYNYSILGNYQSSSQNEGAYAKAGDFKNPSGIIMITESRRYDPSSQNIDNAIGSPWVEPPKNDKVYKDSRKRELDCAARLAYRHFPKGTPVTKANNGMVLEPTKYEPGGKNSVVWLDLHTTTENREELKNPENVDLWGVKYIK